MRSKKGIQTGPSKDKNDDLESSKLIKMEGNI